jgi:hypothetical protein
MKNLLFTSTLFLIVNFSFAQTKIENDLSRKNLKGNVKFYSESGYDLVEKFGEIEKDTLYFKTTYKYDVKGNEIDGILASGEHMVDSATYEYDEKGNEIEYNEYNYDGSLVYSATYEYDEKGNMIENNTYNADGSLSSKYTYNYEFDAMGNWIKKTSITIGKPNQLIERVIEYY